jgi:Mn-dependent DtxR family transcriptional regulator
MPDFCNEIKDLERILRLIWRKNAFQMKDLAEALQVKPQQKQGC